MNRTTLVLLAAAQLNAAVVIQNLAVEYRKTPLGIDVAKPRFSWQMAATAGERGYTQAAYQLQVKDAAGATVWDSQRIAEPTSVAIEYGGGALQPTTRYMWSVTVWDQTGAKRAASSWFETGMMDPAPNTAGWGGAQWIGGSGDDLVLYAPYLAIFDLKYTIAIAPGSKRASFVYGANDSRLMDKNKNIYQLESPRDKSYIKLELDVSQPAGRINIYRVGYKPGDSATTPFKTLDVPAINEANRNAPHSISVRAAFGAITLSVDGAAPSPPVNLNPIGMGGNYLAFGLLCDIGFSLEAGESATFSNVIVQNTRKPSHVLYEQAAAVALAGGASGLFTVRDPSRNSMPMLRTTFRAAKPIASARLYVTSRGIYEVHLNGKRVGEDYYNPGLTQYNKTHFYQTYDVTGMLQPGANALAATLGEGWWSGLLSFGTIWNHFGDRQSLLAKLQIQYKDGTSETVTTNDRTWKFCGTGPIVYSSLDFGEIYDATKEPAVSGWMTAGYDDSKWKPAVSVPLEGTVFSGSEAARMGPPPPPMTFDSMSLLGQIGESARIYRVLAAKSVRETRPGVFVYDLGQNIVGVPRVQVAAGIAGKKLTLRFAEMLYPNLPDSGPNVGMIMTENYRAAISQDVYTMKAGSQVFQPKFTSHGFQYIEITGIPKALPLSAVEGVVISSVHDLTADYKTSNAKVNKLWSNLVWSNIDNFLTIPTDCPQRNERMGWSGDISVFSRTATYVSNADQFLTRHMYAMRDTQTQAGKFTDVAPVGGGFGGLLWGSAGIVVPWETYLQYRDVHLLEQHYPAMVAYMSYLDTTLNATTGITADGQLGDWLGPQNNLLGTPFLTTAYHVFDLGIMAQAAEVLGKAGDAARYREQYEKRKAFFNRTFVNADKIALGGRPPFQVADTQSAYAVGLGLGIFDDANRPAMAKRLADAVERENKDDGGVMRPKLSLMTGFIGTAWISKALSDTGNSALAYRLLQNTQYPSWLYAIDQGASTIWERLNGYTVEHGFGGNNSMNSFNHYSFGAVGQWMMAHSLGIQRDEPGFRKFVLQPEPDATGQMTSAEGYYDSMYGRIRSAWKVEAKRLTYQATVPANTTATLYLPGGSATEGGKPAKQSKGVSFVRDENGKGVYRLEPGNYVFVSRLD